MIHNLVISVGERRVMQIPLGPSVSEEVGIYIVEISCQLLDVLLQLICRLQAILKETEWEKKRFTLVSVTDINIHWDK